MRSLPELVATALERYEEGQVLDLARSEEWLEVRDRYAWLSSRLIVNGHEAVARRVDREYQLLRDALRRAITSSERAKVKDDYPLWEAATEFQLTVKHLEHLGGRIEELSDVKASEALPPPASVRRRSWTQAELDEAIADYRARRGARYSEMLSLLDNPGTPERRKRAVRREAQHLFGRNAVARALGVKSARMVSQSPAWVHIADALGLPRRRRDRAGRRPSGGRRVGLDMAVEEASTAAPETSEYAPAEMAITRGEREKTLARIRKLAESGRDEAVPQAKALYEKYEAGELTDEQVRQTVDLVMAQP
jgi:hypothetical protein